MEPERVDAEWLTQEQSYSLKELAELSGMPELELRELVEHGAITPVDASAAQWAFQGRCLWTVRTACRLRVSFELEQNGLALVVSLLERIRDLEAQLDTTHTHGQHRNLAVYPLHFVRGGR